MRIDNPTNALYCCVAHLGGHYSVTYRAIGNTSCNLSGYSADTFADVADSVPVVRFDLATTESVRASLCDNGVYEAYYPADHNRKGSDFQYLSFADWLTRKQKQGIPVQTMAEFRATA